MSSIESISETIVTGVSQAVIQAAPRILLSVSLVIVSALVIKLAMRRIDDALVARMDTKRNASIARRGIKTALWSVTALLILTVMGYQQVAAAFGTASGLIAVGLSYATKDAIRQAIAGLYLMEDEAFIVGNRVSVGGVSGEIVSISLQRTKIRNEGGDVTTLSNQKIEPQWTIVSASGDSDRN